jgi:hypothetical protein
MEIIVIAILVLTPLLILADPAPGAFRTRAATREMDCSWLGAEEGSTRYPGMIRPEAPRGDYIEQQTLLCREHLMRAGLRADRDEAILRTLEERATAAASIARKQRPDLEDRTWMVEVFYPSPQVSDKIAFATKNALVGQGIQVSDRTPGLSVDDIHVIVRLPPSEAYPVACRRYQQTGKLGEQDVLLAMVTRDLRETGLHTGLCVDGLWTWLR